jgi:hypothetical protein
MHAYLYGPKFMWNLDSSVGKGGANSNPADVSFIQWYYTLASDFHLTQEPNRTIYRKVKITGTCNGTDSDPLVAAIIAQQRSVNHPQVDGKVSVVTGSGKIGANAFFLLRLEARFAVMHPNAWPRLDLIPSCPGTIAQLSRDAIPNMAELMR